MRVYTVVIVEDHTLLSQAIASIVNGFQSFEVLYLCKNGKELMERFADSSKNVADIVLMDIKMPDLNGLEATIEIKKDYPDLPIIAQTAYAMEEDEEASVNAGCDDYISKPIRPENLINKMAKFIS